MNTSDYELTTKTIEVTTTMMNMDSPGTTPDLAPEETGGISLTTEKVG